jgi:hypothetical protein
MEQQVFVGLSETVSVTEIKVLKSLEHTQLGTQ